MEGVLKWAEEHPWTAGALTLGAVFILLWLLGFFGGSSSSQSSNSGTNLAAAYYSAEAAQTTAGTQLQMATQYYTAQTAQDQIQANAATGIAATQANMYTTLGQQNAYTATAVNAQNTQASEYAAGQQAYTATALGQQQLLATENTNNDAAATAQAEAAYTYQTALGAQQAQNYATYANSIWPGLLAHSAGDTVAYVPGVAGFVTTNTTGPSSPSAIEALGYTPAGAALLTGVPYPGYTS